MANGLTGWQAGLRPEPLVGFSKYFFPSANQPSGEK
jgi:hypothetical protein